MRRKTKTKQKKKNTKKQNGGKTYKHRRVGLYFTKPNTKDRYQINCEVCRNNDYIERPSTIGKTKGDQVVVNFLLGDGIFEDLNNISINTMDLIQQIKNKNYKIS